jgi:hypothetical protein
MQAIDLTPNACAEVLLLNEMGRQLLSPPNWLKT